MGRRTNRERLPATRPPHIHPISWLYLQAKASVPGRDPYDPQAWLRRVSKVFDRKLREAGHTYEGQS